MVTETSRYAEQFLNSNKNLKQNARAKMWKPETITEMKAFNGGILEMGITKRQSMVSYWTKRSRSIPWFRKRFLYG